MVLNYLSASITLLPHLKRQNNTISRRESHRPRTLVVGFSLPTHLLQDDFDDQELISMPLKSSQFDSGIYDEFSLPHLCQSGCQVKFLAPLKTGFSSSQIRTARTRNQNQRQKRRDSKMTSESCQ